MCDPERVPNTGLANNFPWSTSGSQGWTYPSSYQSPVSYSSSWTAAVAPGNPFPSPILSAGGSMDPPRSWPFPPPPVNGTGPPPPANIPFCSPPQPPVDGEVRGYTFQQPPPTPVALQPLPTPVALQPPPTPVALQPSPTPVALQPPPTPVALQPPPTPVALQPPHTPVALQPFRAPPPMPAFTVPPPMLPGATMPNLLSGAFPVADTRTLIPVPENEANGLKSSNESGSGQPSVPECAIQETQPANSSLNEKSPVEPGHTEQSDHAKKSQTEELNRFKDPRTRIKGSSRELKRKRSGRPNDSSHKHLDDSTCSRTSRGRESDGRRSRSSRHSHHQSRSSLSPRREYSKRRHHSKRHRGVSASPKRNRSSKDRERRSKSPRHGCKRRRLSGSRKSRRSQSRTSLVRRESGRSHGNERGEPLQCSPVSKGCKDPAGRKSTDKECLQHSRKVEDGKAIATISHSERRSCDPDSSRKDEMSQKALLPSKKSCRKKRVKLGSGARRSSADRLSSTSSRNLCRKYDRSRQDTEKTPSGRDSRYESSRSQSYKRQERITSRDKERKTREEADDSDGEQPALSTEPAKIISCTPAEEFYVKREEDSEELFATDALKELHKRFEYELLKRAQRVKATKPKYDPPVRKTKLRKHKPPEAHSDNSSSCSSKESSSDEEDTALEELERKRQHPDRVHPELWFNDPREMNDGPLCRCSIRARRSGIRHGIYAGEDKLPPCDPLSNNAKRLHHYKIAMTPVTNFLLKPHTIIPHDGKRYIFEGFSLLSHKPLPKLPYCKVIRFNYEYTILYVEEKMPPNFTVKELELFSKFLLEELLELLDLDWKANDDENGCPKFHIFPRFAKLVDAPGDEKELLSMSGVLEYLLKSNEPLVNREDLDKLKALSKQKWREMADKIQGMIVTAPGMKPSSIRVDQLDREDIEAKQNTDMPVIVHFGVRPPQLSYAGNPHYQKAWRDYVKYRHLLANKPKVRYADRHKLMRKEAKLQEMRMENDLKRDVTVVICSEGFYKTGILSDIVQHAMLLPILVCHLRFHDSLIILEDKIGYQFKDRFLLQLALTHPSYRENFGTNPDHARNSLTNCGLRQPKYGDRRIHYMNTRKRGINTLINIMSKFGNRKEAISNINHNERLEFLGDAVVEFLSSIHLFYLFPDLEEGGLATYRAAIVQNQHLAVLSKKLHLEEFMLYAHGSDLCHDLELRHAMANCFEALMGALFLDGGIEMADKVFSKTLFPEENLYDVWINYPLHPLQDQEPQGDRNWIPRISLLGKVHEFEKQIGIEFKHIRLLARALTHRSLGYNNLTLGSNQRLEFLGDTVLQLVASEYLYKFFPQHHEGHLSLLRSSLVNNRTQAVVCGDLGMTDYAIYPYFKVELKPKDKADLLEAFLGALYIDQDLGYCRKFCEVCFFPRLQHFIMNQDWNDPKSKLQQCCLTLRSMDGGEPDIPTYKVIECKGPTNTRVYSVAVYFQGDRLAVGSGHSIQQAEMDAANNALMKSPDLFPQLKHQKRAIERSLKQGSGRKAPSKYAEKK